MLGVRKAKKTKPVRVRSAPSSDEDDGGGDARRLIAKHRKKKKEAKGDSRKKKSKTKATTALSFDPEDAGIDEEEDAPRKKPKKRKKHSSKQRKRGKRSGGGLGYGGLGAMPVGASDSSSEGEGRKAKEEGGEDDDDVRGGNYYDAAALARLRSEQKRSTIAKEDAVNTEPAASSTVYETSEAVEDEDKTPMHGRKAGEDVKEEEFIPLSDGIPGAPPSVADPVVLTGEEAMAYARGEEEDGGNLEFDHGLQSPPTPPPAAANDEKDMTGEVSGMDVNADPMDTGDPSEEVEEGNRRWEDTMARRAGVLPLKAASSSEKNGRSRRPRKHNNDSSLSQIRASLQPTVSNLKNVRSDLDTNIRRHESALSSAREELTKHRSELEDHGEALERYQALREDLATWVGALRELNGMLDKVEGAKRKLEAEMTRRRRERLGEWGRDCAEVLEGQGLLERRVGGGGRRRPDEAAVREVDEFGRDLSSMASMARVRRWNQRRKRCIRRLQDSETDSDDDGKSLRQSAGCSNEDNLGDGEIEEWRKRHEALTKAVAIVPDLVKDEYLSMSNLCKMFFDWESRYPDDYADSYAEMSLVQMLTVLVRLELCKRWDVLGLHRKSNGASCVNVTEFEWFRDLKRLYDSRRNAKGEAEKAMAKANGKAKPKCILVEVVQKQIVDRLLTSLSCDDGRDGNEQHEIYDPFSATQTQRMCSMLMSSLKHISTLSEDNGEALRRDAAEKLLNALLALLNQDVGEMAVIVNASKITLMKNRFATRGSTEEFEGETADAIAYATVIQTEKLWALLKNALQWYTIIRELAGQEGVADSLAQFMFEEIISSRILPILHSLRDMTSGGNGNNKRYYEMPSHFVHQVLEAMQGADLLENDKWMLMAAPLRAVAKQWDDNGP